jgi:hypothetical protein
MVIAVLQPIYKKKINLILKIIKLGCNVTEGTTHS